MAGTGERGRSAPAGRARGGGTWLGRTGAGYRERLRHLRLRGSVEAYVDGELTGVRRARVAEHLTACRACSGTAEALRLIKRSLRSAPDRAPEPLSAPRLRRYVHRLGRDVPPPTR
ncbi:anti-sigma factor family protein [Streptomyces boncukensis]|uniref:Putative zinc-finger domain-containing protein n=1 Tax=Streptomyces boncukensis TaxID=2711219 RepID=A0A6G4X395_9ACTN|nr:zf-HC2 domain-containing protein [Streptomyces boncukensis]NGO71360.1 hypothetical protein [Streptomyces boncukensis]